MLRLTGLRDDDLPPSGVHPEGSAQPSWTVRASRCGVGSALGTTAGSAQHLVQGALVLFPHGNALPTPDRGTRRNTMQVARCAVSCQLFCLRATQPASSGALPPLAQAERLSGPFLVN